MQENVRGFKGEYNFGLPERNILFWVGVSKEAAEALDHLIKRKDIEMQPTTEMNYMIDGAALTPPVAKRNKVYKTARWVPVTLTSRYNPRKKAAAKRN